tara:strand:- start:487 stop:831 length:345 start_codon:yes stop_codon:yes gene_type:complete
VRQNFRVTSEQFRKLALARPGVEEREHMNHPDFRAHGKIFATIGPDATWGMVRLPAREQARVAEEQPTVFEALNGAWGRQGCTRVWLNGATMKAVKPLLKVAWEFSRGDAEARS